MPNIILTMTISNVIVNLFDDSSATAVNAAGAVLGSGNWTSQSAAKDNSLTIKIAGQVSAVVDVNYTFDGNNRLNVAIPVQAGITTAVAPKALAGQIVITDDGNLTYQLLSPAALAAAPTFAIYIYGTASIETSIDQLDILLNRTGQTISIAGDGINNSAQATSGLAPDGSVMDQLVFAASTNNANSTGALVSTAATISFSGIWDLFNNKLVFSSNAYLAGQASPGLQIIIGGNYKGVSGGIEVSMNVGGAPTVVMTLNGSHQWDGGTSTWSLSLGYMPGKSFQMTMTVANTTQNAASGGVTFRGSLAIAQTSPGAPLTIDFELTATCTFKNGNLSVVAKYVTGQPYDLKVSGTLSGSTGDGGAYKLSFSFEYTDSPGANPISLDLTASVTEGDLTASLNLLYGAGGWTANFTLQFSWPYSQTPAKPTAAAPAGAAAAVAAAAPTAVVPAAATTTRALAAAGH